MVNLLWTGGLDSTFRLVELAHEDVEVQPYYIVDSTRGSVPQEMKAMEKILKLLRKKPFVKARLHDVKFIPDSSILPDSRITEAYKFFKASNKLGSQYDYLARFADQNNICLEVGLEGSNRSKASNVLKEYGALEPHSHSGENTPPPHFEHPLTYLAVNAAKCHQNANLIFGNLQFPSHLFTLEKVDEARLLKEWKCGDILKSTWFCHLPIFGYPCGHCNPCKDALNEGMEWRVPMTGRILGAVFGLPRKYCRAAFRKFKAVIGR